MNSAPYASRYPGKRLYRRLLAALLQLIFLTPWCIASETGTTFTLAYPLDSTDRRREWDSIALELALEATIIDYGEFTIQRIDLPSDRRIWRLIEENTHTNLVHFLVYSKSAAENGDVKFIGIPLRNGLLGYRTCLYASENKAQIDGQIARGDWRGLRFGQMDFWADTVVFKRAGLQVVEGKAYKSLFGMLEKGRFDLFCRGVNEVRDELETYKQQYEIELEPTLLFAYPMPVLPVTNSDNKAAIERIETGLERIYLNGTFQSAFHEYFSDRLREINLQDRTLIELENPLVEGMPYDLSPYLFDLRKLHSED